MSPILVPTLAELGIELSRAMGVEQAALARWHQIRDAGATPDEAACDEAYRVISDLTDQIAAIPAASLADLRVKALAMDWHNRTVEAPEDFWQHLGAQLVAGLLDERIA